MPIDPPTSTPQDQTVRPISSEGGWSQLMRTLSRTTPARLYHTDRATRGLARLRRV